MVWDLWQAGSKAGNGRNRKRWSSVSGERGQHKRARSELEKLYTEAPDYEDVAARLGL